MCALQTARGKVNNVNEVKTALGRQLELYRKGLYATDRGGSIDHEDGSRGHIKSVRCFYLKDANSESATAFKSALGQISVRSLLSQSGEAKLEDAKPLTVSHRVAC